MPKYNGHKNYNAWNVSLWIYNDEGLYNLARDILRTSKSKDIAARKMLASLPEKTPDGVKYSLTNIKLALADFS